MNDGEEPSELARVLDAANAVHTNGNGISNMNVDDAFDDDELQNRAREEEERRAAFDAVLKKSSADWSEVSDLSVLRDALIRVLDQIRGPVVETVGPPRLDDKAGGDVTSFEANGLDGDTDMEVDDEADTDHDAIITVDEKLRPATNVQDFCTNGTKKQNGRASVSPDASESFSERAKYIPLRLSHDERKVLRLVEAALNVSTYTDGSLFHFHTQDMYLILCYSNVQRSTFFCILG